MISPDDTERGRDFYFPPLSFFKNMKKFTHIAIFSYAGLGLFTPVLYSVLAKQGFSQLGYFLGLMTISSAISALFVGKIGQKYNLYTVFSVVTISCIPIFILYTIPMPVYLVYLLQLVYGSVTVALYTVEQTLVASLAKKDNLSADIGKYNTFIQLTIGVFMLIGGFLGQITSYKTIVIISVVALAISAILALNTKGSQ